MHEHLWCFHQHHSFKLQAVLLSEMCVTQCIYRTHGACTATPKYPFHHSVYAPKDILFLQLSLTQYGDHQILPVGVHDHHHHKNLLLLFDCFNNYPYSSLHCTYLIFFNAIIIFCGCSITLTCSVLSYIEHNGSYSLVNMYIMTLYIFILYSPKDQPDKLSNILLHRTLQSMKNHCLMQISNLL